MTDKQKKSKKPRKAKKAAFLIPDEEEEQKPLTIEEQKAEKRRIRNKRLSIAGGILSIFFLFWLLSRPYTGGPAFGVCRTFLELYVEYPQELRLSKVEDYGQEMRLWYTKIDPYGESNLDYMQCFFRNDSKTGFALDKVMVNRREVNPETVKSFNVSIPAILASKPDLTLPRPLPDSLEDLQLDPNRYKMRLF